MMLLTHLAGLRIGEVACLRWSDVTNQDGTVKEEIRLLPDMTKGRHARTVFVNIRLREELQAYAAQAKCIDRSYPFFASQKSIKTGFSANRAAVVLMLRCPAKVFKMWIAVPLLASDVKNVLRPL